MTEEKAAHVLAAMCANIAAALQVRVDTVEVAMILLRDGQHVEIASTIDPLTLTRLMQGYIDKHSDDGHEPTH